MGVSLPFLALYYLGALSIGYYSGFFLLMCRARPCQSVLWRQRLQEALLWTTPKVVYCLAALVGPACFIRTCLSFGC